MLKGEITIIQADHRKGKNAAGREYSGYQVWYNAEGYQFPYRTWISDSALDGIELKKDMKGVIYLAQDRNLAPIIRYRFG